MEFVRYNFLEARSPTRSVSASEMDSDARSDSSLPSDTTVIAEVCVEWLFSVFEHCLGLGGRRVRGRLEPPCKRT